MTKIFAEDSCVPDYDEALEPGCQPYVVADQGPFVAIIQRDGSNECVHWALIPKNEVEDFIAKVKEVAA